ncbi:MAG: hypothetical protein AAB520_03865 [Patescibacteria group bacterium]
MDEYKESPETRALKSEIAQERPRDSEGHFIHPDQPAPPQPSTPIQQFASDHISVSRTPTPPKSDDLVDVHVGNPLTKITRLLEDIKKQKAFSFTLKGSLGIAGVALALGVFGVFGGNQLLCSHGTQTQIGIVKTLQFGEAEKSTVPFIGNLIDRVYPGQTRRRIVLVKSGDNIIGLPYSKFVSLSNYEGEKITATGDYNSCSQTLTITDPSGVEPYSQ